MHSFGRRGVCPGDFGRESLLVALAPTSGDLFVVDSDRHRVNVFGGLRRAPDREDRYPFLRAWLCVGDDLNRSYVPTGIALLEVDSSEARPGPGADGAPGTVHATRSGAAESALPLTRNSPSSELLVFVSSFGNLIQVYRASDGALVRAWGSAGGASGQFGHPMGLAASRADRLVLVADRDNHRVQAFRADGTFVRAFGHQGTGPGQLLYPCAVAAAANGEIFVADSGNARIVVFRARDGVFLRAWGSRRDFACLSALAVTRTGEVLVTDYQRCRLFSAHGTPLRPLARDGVEWNHAYVAAGEDGEVALGVTGRVRVDVYGEDGLAGVV